MHASQLAPLASSACALAALAPAAARADGTVVLKPAPGARVHASGTTTVGRVARLGLRVVRVSGDPAAAAARLSSARGVRWAEPNATVHALAAPDDPLFASGPLPRLGAADAWTALGLGRFPLGGGARVGIVDTGIDATHEDLTGKVAACARAASGEIVPGDCADGAGHGTHVAGTIGAVANNGVGLAGVAFSSPLVVCKALGDDGSGTDADVAACVRWVHDAGAKVISMSLGGSSSRTIGEAVRYAWEGGGRGGGGGASAPRERGPGGRRAP